MTLHGLVSGQSLVETRTFDARDQMQRYLKWHKEGYLSSTGVCFDVGATTYQALHRYQEPAILQRLY